MNSAPQPGRVLYLIGSFQNGGAERDYSVEIMVRRLQAYYDILLPRDGPAG